MPTPNDNETREEFISRCIPYVMDEGKTRDQAMGMCYGIWKQHHPGTKAEIIGDLQVLLDNVCNDLDELKAKLPHISGHYTPYVPSEGGDV